MEPALPLKTQSGFTDNEEKQQWSIQLPDHPKHYQLPTVRNELLRAGAEELIIQKYRIM